jgi:hypothetical protein
MFGRVELLPGSSALVSDGFSRSSLFNSLKARATAVLIFPGTFTGLGTGFGFGSGISHTSGGFRSRSLVLVYSVASLTTVALWFVVLGTSNGASGTGSFPSVSSE